MWVLEQGVVTRAPATNQDGGLVFIPLDGLLLQNFLYVWSQA